MSNVASANRCQHLSKLGRRCRERRSTSHPSLCAHHARHPALPTQTPNLEPPTSSIALELLGPVQDFRSAASINHVLGKLLVLVNTQRISPRNAAVTAYICQLLLQSLAGVKDELHDFHSAPQENWPEFQKCIKKILKADAISADLPAIPLPVESPLQAENSETAAPILAGVSRATS